jgi:hypothetical protein
VPSYTVGYIDVYRNGVRLVSTDFTATTGTTVVLANACTSGDSVVTESFYVSSVLNAIPNTGGSVSASNLAASGTGSSSNFLRGDMAWTSATGTGSVVLGTSPTLTTPNINSAQIATVSGTAPLYMTRAWVNFNGTGTVAIRASANVSSITDNGIGDYTVNFTTSMPDADYAVSMSLRPTSASQERPELVTLLAASVRVVNDDGANNPADTTTFTVAVFR